ncbi:MAG: hypothetical protein M3P49_11940 [Actinomycetota bacterium]|nr:hypothetical protein [Actinomycetota bacterium]
MKCKGKNRKTGEPCKASAIAGREYCRVHGGKVPRGVAHPNFRHGRRSKDLVANLQERYEEALSDADLLNLADEIALSDAYLAEVLKSGESGRRWKDVKKAFAALEAAMRSGDAPAAKARLVAMREVVEGGVEDWAHRDEVMRRLEQRRKLVESENRRRADSRFALTYEEMMAQVAAMVDVMRKRIEDRDLLRAITRDFEEIVRGTGKGEEVWEWT